MNEFLTDRELAALLRVTPSTVSRLVSNGPRSRGIGVVDLRLAEPIMVGKCRRWPAGNVRRLLGIGADADASAAAHTEERRAG